MSSSRNAAGDTSAIRFRRLRLGIGLCGALVLIGFAGASAYDAWRAYRASLAATDREIGNIAKALADQTAWTWDAVDVLLRDTALWYRSEGQKIPPENLGEGLATLAEGLPQVRLITLVDAHGIQHHRSRGVSPPDLDVSDRAYFIAQRDGTATGLFVSEPLITRSENRAGVILSRRLEDDHGTFAGVVTAIMELEELRRFYGAIDLGEGGAIQLMRDDGTLIVRNPATPVTVGRKFPELAVALDPPNNRLVSPIDGKHDIVASVHVTDTPLMLTVTREEAVALRPWRDDAIRLGASTLIVTLLGALTIAALMRQLRRVETGQRALRESEERYALAMEGANEGHFDWDIATDNVFMSETMKRLWGHSANSVAATRTAWRAATVIHPDDDARFQAALQDHLEGRAPKYECDYRVRHADGVWHWLHARGLCMRDATGKPYRFVGSTIDVTAQKQAAIDKEQLEAQLRQSQKMEAIGTLAGGIAHDFNNILGAILGYGELAQRQAAAGSALRRYLDNVMHAAERAKVLVDRILGFSRSGLGERAMVNVQSVVEETLELLEASLPPGIRLEKRLEGGNAAVNGDATYLHQVVMNLCTNALQAMEHGGVLGVVVDSVVVNEARSLARGTLAPGPYVRVAVSDTGSGIPPAVVERMFDPFFTTKGLGQGTGLGLSLVHGIVADLGGAIGLTTGEGKGTTFEIWLPAVGDLLAPSAEAASELPIGNGEVVMIVDDEELLVTLAEEMLAELGYEPVGFDSSRVALSAFAAEPERFDLVLTDEAMPDLVGTELARALLRLRPTLPIILMSGHGGVRLAERAAEIGVREVLHKPLQQRDLAESFARVLGSAKRADAKTEDVPPFGAVLDSRTPGDGGG